MVKPFLNAPNYLLHNIRDEGVDIVSYAYIQRERLNLLSLVFLLIIIFFTILLYHNASINLKLFHDLLLGISIILIFVMQITLINILNSIKKKTYFAVTNKGLHIAYSRDEVTFYPWLSFEKEVIHKKNTILIKRKDLNILTSPPEVKAYKIEFKLPKIKKMMRIPHIDIKDVNLSDKDKQLTTHALENSKNNNDPKTLISYTIESDMYMFDRDNYLSLDNVHMSQLVYNHIEHNMSLRKNS